MMAVALLLTVAAGILVGAIVSTAASAAWGYPSLQLALYLGGSIGGGFVVFVLLNNL